MRTESIIRTEQLTRSYGEGTGIFDIDLSVGRGRVLGVVGPNGAGKTTLLSIVAGLRRAGNGRVRSDAERVVFCPDVPDFEPWLTAAEVVALSAGAARVAVTDEEVAAALDRVGLSEAAGRRNGRFSRGMRQRLSLAAALVCRPDLLILDEPVSGLDPQGRVDVLDLLTSLRGEHTIILASHMLGDVQRICDDVAVLVRGRLVYQGPVGDIAGRVSSGAWHVRVRGSGERLAELLAAQPWVASAVLVEPDCVYLEVAEAESGELGVPRLLAEHRIPLVAMTGYEVDLESAFLSLTNRRGR